MTDEVKSFLDKYLGKPLESYTKKQIMTAIQEYLIDCGYRKEKTIATIEYVTNGGRGVDFNNFLNVREDSKFVAKLAQIDVARGYSYYASISMFAPDIYNLYVNLNDIEDCRYSDGTYTTEGKKKLESALGNFISVSKNLVNKIPGGFAYSKIFGEIPDLITTTIDKCQKYNLKDYGQAFLIDIDLISDEWENIVTGNWEHGATLNQLESLYERYSDDPRLQYLDGY